MDARTLESANGNLMHDRVKMHELRASNKIVLQITNDTIKDKLLLPHIYHREVSVVLLNEL